MYNKVILIGRLTKELELKKTNESHYARFTLAVNERLGDGKEDRVDFINCVVWGKLAEVMAKHLNKGSLIQLDGKIRTGSYEGQNGTVYTTDVVASNVVFLDSKPTEAKEAKLEERPVDSLPF